MSASIVNWGRYPRVDGELVRVSEREQAERLVGARSPLIARGLGRCYGDSSLAETMLAMPSYRRITAFDPASGEISCQAGVSIAELLEIFLPRGWFPPVTPGTKFVTVGGAIASDVHGKNHHVEGSFCRHVESLLLMTAAGEVIECSRESNPEIFAATCGGMGLTGLILSATFGLKPVETAYIREETIVARNLDEIMTLFDESTGWTYSVAWIDCLAKGMKLGRSVMMRGEHARLGELDGRRAASPFTPKSSLQLKVPIDLPSFTLNNMTASIFNYLIYHKYRNETMISSYDSFFYPLDSIDNWNRIYGRKGFTQYQCVLPRAASARGMQRILGKISSSGMGSFLAVLKLFGQQDDFISFPMEGYTLALDFPIRRGLFPLLDELDRIVLDHGGRLYLTKDARMRPEMFFEGYPHAREFVERIEAIDPGGRFRSLQSDRLEISK